MQKATDLDQITLSADGSIGLKILKRIIDDDGSVFFSEPHRASVDALGDVVDQVALVDAHLIAMGFPALPDRAVAAVSNLSALHRSSPDIKARQDEVRAERASMTTLAALDAKDQA